MTLTYSFGEWIAQRRKQLDLTQRDLAEHVSCGLATVKKIEADQRRPSRDLAALMAGALSVPAQQQATFIECARGLRAVDALVDVGIEDRGQAGLSLTLPSPGLPMQLTHFVGRQTELMQIENYLKDPACRLLTLVGPGGIGKTRLAYEAASHSAERFTSGVYALSLAGIEQTELVTAAIAQRLGAPSSGDATRQILGYLRDRSLLLVLDNLEHLLEGIGVLADLLAEAPAVKIIATSRERLNLKAEWLLPIGGLAYPARDAYLDTSAAASYPALQLFEQAAQRVLPGYQVAADLQAIVRVCHLVEGMPLAIELAANWVRRMRPEQIAQQIEQDAGFLAASWRDVPDRHRSIGALFDYSWHTLSAAERASFARLSVFHNGFDAAAAQRVAGASWPILTALEDKSLVRASRSGRYGLHELIRQYARNRLEELEPSQSDEVCRQHAVYYMNWAEVAATNIRGQEQAAWFRHMDAELDNLRAALDWAFAHGQVEIGLRLCICLRWYWQRRGLIQEAFRWFSRGLALSEGWHTPLRAQALEFGASAAALAHEPIVAQYARQTMALAAELQLPGILAEAQLHRTHALPDYSQVVPIVETNLAILRLHGNRWDLADHLASAAGRARDQGDFARAERMLAECLALATELGAIDTIATAQGQLGRLAIYRQDYAAAQESLATALRLARELGNRMGVADWLTALGRTLMYQQTYEEAQGHLEEALDLWRDIGDQIGVADALGFLAALSVVRQEYDVAAQQLRESFSITGHTLVEVQVSQLQGVISRLNVTASIALQTGQPEIAAQLLSASEGLRTRVNYALEPVPLADYVSAVKQSRSLLSEASFGVASAAGERMNAEAALQLALAFLGQR